MGLVGSDRGQPTISGDIGMFLAVVVAAGIDEWAAAADCRLCVELFGRCYCYVRSHFEDNTHWGLPS